MQNLEERRGSGAGGRAARTAGSLVVASVMLLNALAAGAGHDAECLWGDAIEARHPHTHLVAPGTGQAAEEHHEHHACIGCAHGTQRLLLSQPLAVGRPQVAVSTAWIDQAPPTRSFLSACCAIRGPPTDGAPSAEPVG